MSKTSLQLRLGFAGTPAFAATILDGLIAAGREPVVVYTQPDRPTGRGRRPQPSPVKALAQSKSIPVEQPVRLRDPGAIAIMTEYHLDLLIVAAYGLILPQAIVELPTHGCINVHASLLPRWRGAAPIERAIMAGDVETGVCIMKMDAGLDTGPVYECRRCPIKADTDGPSLERTLAALGSALLLHHLNHIGEAQPHPQSEIGATYAPKLTRADAAIRWGGPAPAIERQVRALTGRMPAFASCADTQLRVLEAQAEAGPADAHREPPGVILEASKAGLRVACGQGVLRISRLQLSRGKGKPLSAADALNGYPELLSAGRVLHDGLE